MDDISFEFDSCDVEAVEGQSDCPLRITFRSTDGRYIEVNMRPSDADRFGRKVVIEATKSLQYYRPRV